MKKYLVNRILRSIFSIIMVMILSVVLIFSLVPQSFVADNHEDVKTLAQKGDTDGAEEARLRVLKDYGYIDYVSQDDYCRSKYSNTSGEGYKACVLRYDDNEDKQEYVEKYKSLGWTEVKLTKSPNCDKVTRKDVKDGKYQMKEDQYFLELDPNGPSDVDELYEYYEDNNGETKVRVVTFNNITYFKKNVNPLLTFWKWLTNLISFDNKNKVDVYRQWDHEKQEYLTEDYVYDIKFDLTINPNKTPVKNVEYRYESNDIELKEQVLEFVEDGKKVNYISIGGISTGVVSGTKNIKDFEVNKIYNDPNNGEEGGRLEINVTFNDNKTIELSKDVAKFLKDGIPLYVGDDNIWYIGNTIPKYEDNPIPYATTYMDWDKFEEVTTYNELIYFHENVPQIERGYSIQRDEYGAPALTCAGCEHKYMIYFDNSFPYIHFNFVQFNLGESILGSHNGKDVAEIMTDKQGDPIYSETEYLTGEKENDSKLFHTCEYKDKLDGIEERVLGDNYANCEQVKTAPSKIAISFIIGIFATIIAYFVGVPVGVLMARNKEKIIDKIGMVYIIIMFAVPSLAYIYFVRSIGYNLFKLPVKHEYGQFITYILPIISLSLGSIASMMMWTRRYIIDQENSDYVKFARAKGLSESQIFFKHILRNAIVPIAHGVPGSIIGSVAGAMITEQIYVVEGTGGMMVESIQKNNNWAAIGLIFFFSFLGIASLIMGDVVITLVDPRISFADTGGRK